MNKEEAIELLRGIDVKSLLPASTEISDFIIDEYTKINNAITTILNLVERQEKEIAELRGRIKILESEKCLIVLMK